MALMTAEIIQTLKTKGLRVTPQRFSVYANLLARADHPTAEQILLDLNQNGPQSSQATVYSSLQALQKAGLIREVLLESGVSRYDANIQPHHHFRCRCCGEIQDIPWAQLQDLNLQSLQSGRRVEGYEITIHGVCDDCHPTERF
ncbi:Fur family transcriptional regulator [Synechocystis sp. LKSZ1]|uniref:Fur family transcriptional regulator n=1 Tax=Synechocystis sp. LKSZ1 TaxID=3144951 RepID=UPI00336BD66A